MSARFRAALRLGSAARYAVTTLLAAGAAAAIPAPAAVHGTGTQGGQLLSTSVVTTGPTTTPYAVARATGATAAWQQGIAGAGVDVALIDTGVAKVAGLAGVNQVLAGPDAVTGRTGGTDLYGHGTVMAGLIAGHDPAHVPGDPAGANGLAPLARLVSLRLSGRDGRVSDADLVTAVRWVTDHAHDPGAHIRVINLSVGLPAADRAGRAALLAATAAAWKAGIVVVSAGGNDGPRAALDAPASGATGIAVGAAAANGRPAGFTSLGTSRRLDLLAPGVSVLGLRAPGSTLLRLHPTAGVGTRWLRGSGSSQAAAVVSGAAALLLSAHPELSPDQVRNLLRSTARRAAPGLPGSVDIAAALRAATRATPGSTTQGSGSHTTAHAGSTTPTAAGSATSTTKQVSWRGSSWRGSSWRGVSWRGVSWRGSSWRGVSWRGVSWRGVSWRGVSWRGVSWRGVSWRGVSWR